MTWLISFVLTVAIWAVLKGRTYEWAGVAELAWRYVRDGLPTGIRILITYTRRYPGWLIRKPYVELKKRFWKSRRGKGFKKSKWFAIWNIYKKGAPKQNQPKYMTQDQLWKVIEAGNDYHATRIGDKVYFGKAGEIVDGFNLKSRKFEKPHDIQQVKRSAQVRPEYTAAVPPPLEDRYQPVPNA